MVPRSIFDPAPESLPVRSLAAIVLALLLGIGATVWGYLDSTARAAAIPAAAPLLEQEPELLSPPTSLPLSVERRGEEAAEPSASRRRERSSAYGSPRAAVRILPARPAGEASGPDGVLPAAALERGDPPAASFAPQAQG